MREYLASSPEDSFLQHALALEYIKLGKDNEARKLFEEIISREPGYVGTYYHLGKLLERSGDTDGALGVYETGMDEARKAGDNHSLNELRAAWDDLSD